MITMPTKFHQQKASAGDVCRTQSAVFRAPTLVIAMLLAAGPSAFARQPSPARPNLVFVFSDQQSADMLGCYGNKDVKTPNLDRLAQQGVRFTQCISSSPICTPFRAMLLSGQHTLRNGAIGNDIRMLPGKGNYFAEVLRDHGYRTGYFGKWHLHGGDRDRPIPPGPYRYGFDHEFLSNNCTLLYDKDRAYYWDENGKRRKYGDWEPYAQTRQAIEFVRNHARQPFALFMSWHPPHSWREGYRGPADLMKFYDPAKLHLRAGGPDNPRLRAGYQGHMAMITANDRAFGWLMQALKDNGIENNTIVVFTADHGDALGTHGNNHAKMRPEQESIHVPLLVRFPDRLQPRVSKLLVGSLDLMPTLLGLMQLPIPGTCDGRDLSRFMTEGDDEAVDAVPLFLPSRDFRGVYTRRYTYCYDSSVGGSFEFRDRKMPRMDWNILYDRQLDPHEMKNRFDAPEYQAVRERLHAKTLDWMKKIGDRGWSYQTIVETVFDKEEQASQVRGGKVRNGVPLGSPLELLKDVPDSSRTHH